MSVLGLPVGWILVAVALITTIPAIFYYMRVVIKMIAQEPRQVVSAIPAKESEYETMCNLDQLALGFCAIIILAAGTILVDPVMSIAHRSIEPIVLRL